MDYRYIPTYLKQIEDKARETNNFIHSITPSAPHQLDMTKIGQVKVAADTVMPVVAKTDRKVASTPDKSNYQVMMISLNISGSYVNLVRFLDALRKFPKMVMCGASRSARIKTPGRSRSIPRWKPMRSSPLDNTSHQRISPPAQEASNEKADARYPVLGIGMFVLIIVAIITFAGNGSEPAPSHNSHAPTADASAATPATPAKSCR